MKHKIIKLLEEKIWGKIQITFGLGIIFLATILVYKVVVGGALPWWLSGEDSICDAGIPGSIHGILQARILERVAFNFSRGSEPRSHALQADSLPVEPQEKPKTTVVGSLSLFQGIFLSQGSSIWRRKWQPTPVFLPGESRGWKSLAGYSPGDHKDK